MNATPRTPPSRRSHLHSALGAIVLGALMSIGALAQDRFIVPVPSSPPSSPAPSSSSSSSSSDSSSSSSSSSSSYTPSDSSPPPPPDHRFVVPVPSSRPATYGGSGGSPRHSGYVTYDWYAADCFYWQGRYYYGGGFYYSPFGDGSGYGGGQPPTPRQTTPAGTGNRLPIYFPPVPPPLHTPVPAAPPGQPALPAPEELRTYVTDPFYAPLSTRLAMANVSDALRRRLDAYQATKISLQAELQRKLAALAATDPTAKESALAAFAREQTPRIAAWETTAESLRTDFLRAGLVGLFSGTGDWNEHRSWRLGTSRTPRVGGDASLAKFWVIRAAVFYQDGLSPAQRRLLREVAMELQAEAFKPTNGVAAREDGVVFFSPDTARVHFPFDLPPEMASKVDHYAAAKTALKAELCDTLVQQDRATASARAHALKNLAAAQQPRLDALEKLAEEIRHDLAARGIAPATIVGPVPPKLAATLAAYKRARQSLQDAIRTKLEEIARVLPPSQFTVRQNLDDSTGENTLLLEMTEPGISGPQRRELQQSIATFNRSHREHARLVLRRQEELRAAVAEYTAGQPDAAHGRSIEALMQELTVTSFAQETQAQYDDYATAAFQPGLSPEQRRLLFDSAVQRLELPLPGGEYQP